MNPDAIRRFASEFREVLDRHVASSDHHPEHYAMPLESRMHLTCAVLGKVMARAKEYGIEADVARCRAHVEKNRKQWRDWKHAVVDRLPPASDEPLDLPDERRPRLYGWRQLERLDSSEFSWIHELQCVRDYLEDLLREKCGVLEAWREIVEKHDDRFAAVAERVQDHDLDLFRPDAIRAAVKHVSQWDPDNPQMPLDHPLGVHRTPAPPKFPWLPRPEEADRADSPEEPDAEKGREPGDGKEPPAGPEGDVDGRPEK